MASLSRIQDNMYEIFKSSNWKRKKKKKRERSKGHVFAVSWSMWPALPIFCRQHFFSLVSVPDPFPRAAQSLQHQWPSWTSSVAGLHSCSCSGSQASLHQHCWARGNFSSWWLSQKYWDDKYFCKDQKNCLAWWNLFIQPKQNCSDSFWRAL